MNHSYTCKTKFLISMDEKFMLSIGSINSILYDFEKQKLIHINKELLNNILEHKTENLPEEIRKTLHNEYQFNDFNFIREDPVGFNKIYIDLTDFCNLKCKNCFHANKDDVVYAKDEILDKLTALPQSKGATLTLLGGEPLLYPKKKLKSYIKKWSTHFSNINVNTNGTPITKDLAEFFKEYQIFVKLTFWSIDENKHNKYVDFPNHFSILLRKFKILKKFGVDVCIGLVLDETDMLAYRKGDSFFCTPEFKEYVQFVEIRRPSNIAPDNFELIKSREKFEGKKAKPIVLGGIDRFISNLNYHPCYKGMISIDINGNIYNCPWEQYHSLGNIKTVELSETSDLAGIFNWRKPLWADFSKCAECEFVFSCFRCSYMDNQALDTLQIDKLDKPYFCKYEPTTGIYESKEYQPRIKSDSSSCGSCNTSAANNYFKGIQISSGS